MNFDYVRYPAPDLDYSRIALDRFKLWVLPRLDEPTRTRFAALETSDPLIYADSLPDLFSDFRHARISEMVERIYYGVKKRAPHVVVSADGFANSRDAYENRYPDWTSWLRRGFLDVAALMAYSPDTERFADQIKVAVAAGGPNRVWAGIGSWRIPVESTVEKIQAARALGAKGIVLFSYDAAVRKSEQNPNADYLQHVMRAAFGDARVSLVH